MLKVKILPVTPFKQNCTLVWCSETMQGAAGRILTFNIKKYRILKEEMAGPIHALSLDIRTPEELL